MKIWLIRRILDLTQHKNASPIQFTVTVMRIASHHRQGKAERDTKVVGAASSEAMSRISILFLIRLDSCLRTCRHTDSDLTRLKLQEKKSMNEVSTQQTKMKSNGHGMKTESKNTTPDIPSPFTLEGVPVHYAQSRNKRDDSARNNQYIYIESNRIESNSIQFMEEGTYIRFETNTYWLFLA